MNVRIVSLSIDTLGPDPFFLLPTVANDRAHIDV
jgi:hypothetical protein